MHFPSDQLSSARALGAALAIGLFLAAGCASNGFNGTVYHGKGFAFEIPAPPPDWERLEVSNATLAFRDRTSDATILINARCGIEGDDVPLLALTKHLFLDFTERKIKSQEIVPFDGREAMHTVLEAKLDGVPMAYDAWVLKKDGCIYDLLYMADPARFESGRGRFTALVQGFQTVTPDGE